MWGLFGIEGYRRVGCWDFGVVDLVNLWFGFLVFVFKNCGFLVLVFCVVCGFFLI